MIATAPPAKDFGWLGIIRLGLVQASLGAIIILTTSTLNRVMTVELGLMAMIPGALVGLHYGVQLSRPHWGYSADEGGARTPWILGGMAVLALGAVLAALGVANMEASLWQGMVLAVTAFVLIGGGVGAAGTNLLALLAMETKPERKAAAAGIVWIMMIIGFIITAASAGTYLDIRDETGAVSDFSMNRLVLVVSIVSGVAFLVSFLATFRLEHRHSGAQIARAEKPKTDFKTAFAEIWAEPQARHFTIFVFVSMLAYSAQDLILEPFAGLIHGYTPGESTKLAAVQNQGALIGMIATAIVGSTIGKSRAGFMRMWTVAGCIGSAIALGLLAVGASVGMGWPLKANVFGLGLANGAFAVAAIGSMMALASAGREGREGTRMGLWGASQAVAFGLGSFLGTLMIDAARAVFDTPTAFGLVFSIEGALFLASAVLALGVGRTRADDAHLPLLPAGEPLAAAQKG